MKGIAKIKDFPTKAQSWRRNLSVEPCVFNVSACVSLYNSYLSVRVHLKFCPSDLPLVFQPWEKPRRQASRHRDKEEVRHLTERTAGCVPHLFMLLARALSNIDCVWKPLLRAKGPPTKSHYFNLLSRETSLDEHVAHRYSPDIDHTCKLLKDIKKCMR